MQNPNIQENLETCKDGAEIWQKFMTTVLKENVNFIIYSNGI